MKIRVLETTKAAKDKTGLSAMTYKKGEEYDIFDEMAVVFIKNRWGEEVVEGSAAIEKKALTPKLENKAIESSPENKEEKVEKKPEAPKKPKKKSLSHIKNLIG